jgi:opacity protein-like surface antigen
MVSASLLLCLVFFHNRAYSQVTSKPVQQSKLKPIQKKYEPKVEIAPTYGYQFNGSINFVEGKMNLHDAANFGAIVSVNVRPEMFAEFSYSRSNTDADYTEYATNDEYHYNLSIDYFQLGVLKEFKTEMVRPFVIGSLGAAWANMKDSGVDDIWRFSIALGGGAKFILTDRIGIRLQGRLLIPMYFYGGGFYMGIGGGGPSSGVSLSSTSRVIQGDLSVGVIIRLGE